MHYRQLYRRLFYIFSERLQASAELVACAVEQRRPGIRASALSLFNETRKHVGALSGALMGKLPIYGEAKERLQNVMVHAKALKQLLMDEYSATPPPFAAPPPLATFDSFPRGYACFEDSYCGNNSGLLTMTALPRAKDFAKLYQPHCPSLASVDDFVQIGGSAGGYQVLHQLFEDLKEKAIEGLSLVVEERGSKVRSFQPGALMMPDLLLAGKNLSKFADDQGNGEFDDEDKNVANFELRLLDKLYRKGTDEGFDGAGLSREGSKQPGLIYEVKQLVSAVRQLSVNPFPE